MTKVEHLEQAVEALDTSLSDSELAYLEEPYEPAEIPYDRARRIP